MRTELGYFSALLIFFLLLEGCSGKDWFPEDEANQINDVVSDYVEKEEDVGDCTEEQMSRILSTNIKAEQIKKICDVP